MKLRSCLIGFSLAATLFCSPAMAASAWCTSKITTIFSGDEGRIVLHFQSGFIAAIPTTDPDLKNTLTLATSALLAGKSLTVRYETTLGSDVCNSSSGADYLNIPVTGVYLNAN